jgi:hypothetical protein
MVKRIQSMSHRHHVYTVFRDVVALIAIEFSNTVDRPNPHWHEREKEFKQLVGKYTKEELEQVPILIAELMLAFEIGPRDILGEIYMELDLGNKNAGQFFTPWEVCQLMGALTLDTENIRELLKTQKFVTMHEPAVGAGAMVMACADHLHQAGINYQQVLHVSAIDVDITAVHMAYVQFSMMHIPAVVIHGNSLTMSQRSYWLTPAHIMGGWSRKLDRHYAARREGPPEAEAAVADMPPPATTADTVDDVVPTGEPAESLS